MLYWTTEAPTYELCMSVVAFVLLVLCERTVAGSLYEATCFRSMGRDLTSFWYFFPVYEGC